MAQTEAIIEFDKISKLFKTRGADVLAIEDVSFAIKRGEFISVLGPSGCGKTTLLRILAGLDSPTSGTVSLNGAKVRGPQQNTGIVFQSPALMSWRTALTNLILPRELLRLPAAESQEKAEALLKLVGLEEFGDKYPHELSGGMQQRVAIARALVHEPEVLLLDEPFSALDAMTRNQLNVELLRIWEESKKTSLLITHSVPEAVFLSDRVVVLSQRPATICEIVEIELPRNRTPEMRLSTEFLEIVRHLSHLVGLEYA